MTDREPHIAVVTQPLGKVGIGQTRPFLELLSEHADVTLVTASENGALADYDCRYYARENTRDGLVGAGLQFVGNQLRMARLLRRVNPDVAWFYGSTLYTAPILAAKASGLTVVCQPKGDVPLALYLNSDAPKPVRLGLMAALRTLNRTGYAAADRLVTYTESMADEYGLNGQRTLTDAARHVTADFEVRVPMAHRPERVGFLGRMNHDKNLPALIEAARRVSSGFHFAGDGPLLADAQDQLADVPGVSVHGWVDDPVDYLNSLRWLVLPATPIEGLPTVALEALACGTPVMAPPVCGIPDVVVHGETGMHMTGTDAAAIAAHVEAGLSWNLNRLHENCRDRYEREFTREAAVERYAGLVQAVTDV